MLMILIAALPQPCVVPPVLASFARPAAGEAGTVIVPGRAVRVPLALGTKLAVAPERAPAPGTYGGGFPLTVVRAGRYRVALDGPVWIELVRGGPERVTSVAHGHAPTCSGARKMVDFDLTPGSYIVQLSGAKAAAATVLVAAL